jgi:CRISPR/Cas system-associated endoribonuclease Cas2
MKTIGLFLLILIFNSCSRELRKNNLQTEQEEIRFSTHHLEYALKKYDRDSIKLSHPLQYIKNTYYATYALNARGLVIYKSDKRNANTHTILFKAPLKREQVSRFHQAIGYINVDSIASKSTRIGADDGFQVEVELMKKGKSTPFFWSNTYVPPLFDLLSLVNTLSPDSLKFYPVTEEAAFSQYLQGMSVPHK